ncbi:cupin domain-containing protein [Aquisalimonas sp.]|uniref:cupin domain-containing protein n=1 Tax=unclassified Aquisalimonas TaxID=2644645 RepID=UPI0025B98BA3|nr:cupin domain-containing protein [Aquisalimonas sp.]
MRYLEPKKNARRPWAVATALGLTALLTAGIAQAEPEPIAAEPLMERNAFRSDVSIEITQQLDGLPEQRVTHGDASHVTVVRFTIQPGAVFPWHTHPGTVLVNITEGEFVFVFAEDCEPRAYGPGDVVVDPGDTVHTSYNPSDDEETVVMAVLIGAPAEGPLTIHVDHDEGVALDEECGIERNGM